MAIIFWQANENHFVDYMGLQKTVTFVLDKIQTKNL